MKVIFKKEPSENDLYDATFIEMKVELTSLEDILGEFKSFLQACGFMIRHDSEIEIVDDDEIVIKESEYQEKCCYCNKEKK